MHSYAKKQVFWNKILASQINVILPHPQIKSGFYSLQMSSNTESLSDWVLEWREIADLGRCPSQKPLQMTSTIELLIHSDTGSIKNFLGLFHMALFMLLQLKIMLRYYMLQTLKGSNIVMLCNNLCLRFSHWNLIWGSRKTGIPNKTLLKCKYAALYSWCMLIYLNLHYLAFCNNDWWLVAIS